MLPLLPALSASQPVYLGKGTSEQLVGKEMGYLEQVIIGNLLGDAWMERKSPTANARLRYEQTSPKHDDRFYYTYHYYALYCSGNSRTRIRTDLRTGTVYTMNMFTTRAMPFFTPFYELFYINGVKTVPLNIAEYLTPVSIAFWIMDDAHWNGGLTFNTQSFSVEGVELLARTINTKLNINSYLRMEDGLPTIYVPKRDVFTLAEAVKPFMHPSTYYKLGITKLS